MKNSIVLIALQLMFIALIAKPAVTMKGSINNKYQIEVELNADANPGEISGRYRYAGKTAYLDLVGVIYGSDVIYLKESYEGKETGEFYLEIEEGKWEGTWVGNNAVFPVSLEMESGTFRDLGGFELSDYTEKCSNSIEGSYAEAIWWVNDMWAEEEPGNLEIGFNGGVMTVKEISAQEIEVNFTFMCGPTYHLAYYNGKAQKIGDKTYEAKFSEFDDDESCHLIFKFMDRGVKIDQKSSSMACGFGARAYADGEYPKVNDKVVEGDDPTLEDALGR